MIRKGVSVCFSSVSCVLSVVFLIFYPFTLQGQELSADVYLYQETVGDAVTSFSWQVVDNKQQRIVSVVEKDKSFVNVCSDDISRSFWTIRADTFDVTTLQVEKKGEEEIEVNSRKIPVLKVELRAEGFYAHFWHGTYWYRKSDKLFIMYRSVHGPLGTAETVVKLTVEPEEPGKS